MKKGFTLIELMVVVVIIGVLAALAIPKFLGAVEKAKLSEWKVISKQIVRLQVAHRYHYGHFRGNGTPVGLSLSTANNAVVTKCPNEDPTSIQLLGFKSPGGDSRFNYWTSGTQDAGLVTCETAFKVGDITVGTQGLMDEDAVSSGDLTNY